VKRELGPDGWRAGPIALRASDGCVGIVIAMSTPDLVWHYTKHNVIEKIITNHAFWAADVGGLNDVTEIRLGNKRVRQAYKALRRDWDWYDDTSPEIDFDELKESLDSAANDAYHGSAFVTCFSPVPDDTEQWQKYAQADGFAVGIPYGVYLPVIGEHAATRTHQPYIEEFPLRWLNMLYDKQEQLEVATRAIWEIQTGIEEGAYIDARQDADDNFGSIFRDRGSSGYVDAVASIKHKDFIREREVRYAVARPENPAAIHPNPLGLKPHVRITGAATDPFSAIWDRHDPDFYQATVSNLPILKIRVGPGNEYKAIEPWLRGLLDSNGYGAVQIKKSKSPFR
jgi:hypothetical protein